MFGPIEKIVSWLRAGYPEGIPAHDYVPLVALLRRRMTDDEINEVGARLDALGLDPARSSHVGAEMMAVLNEVPAPEEIRRVSSILQASGWPVSDDEFRRPVIGPTVHLFYGPAKSGKTTLARQLQAAGAIRFSLGTMMKRLYPHLQRGTLEHAEASVTVTGLIWELAQQVLASGGDVVLDLSAWSRSGRLRIVDDARALGAVVVIHVTASTPEDGGPLPDGLEADPPLESEGLRVVQG